MTGDDLDFMKSYLQKVNRLFKMLVTAVVLLEFALLVRGLLFFNLERLKLRLYIYSYGFLFCTSLAALVMLCLFGHREAHFKKTLFTFYIYAFCFMMWAAGITCIDCLANGDSGIIVYVMSCISVGVLALLKPWVFLCYLTSSSAFLLMTTAALRGWEPFSTGFYLNFAVFMGTALFINGHNYNLSLREYQARKTLEHHSETDPLTGLYNRRRLDRQMQEMYGQQPFVLAVMDVDDFKLVNDQFGHIVGDACLAKTAQVLQAYFDDRVYRLGGDEFVIVSPLDMAETCRQLDEINRELSTVVTHCPLRLSAGLYAFRQGDSQKDAFAKADSALYQAKTAGCGGWMIYQEQLQADA